MRREGKNGETLSSTQPRYLTCTADPEETGALTKESATQQGFSEPL